ncbi:MAG: prolipoprotein diacylglyceryl transferase [bacterium]|nr:prolipoprotein diacylglyceryl transferase [bacterium]
MNFLHTYNPEPIALSVGFLDIYWYGIIIALAVVIGFFIITKLAKNSVKTSNHIIDLVMLFIIAGVIGGRIGHIIGDWEYYVDHLNEIIKIWQGGLAVHGVIAADLIVAVFYSRWKKISFWQITDLFVIILPLMQAIVRWGNYFNQEIFGLPTGLPWGLAIDIRNRPEQYINNSYFHPMFLYESILMLGLFLIMLWLFKKKKLKLGMLTILYFIAFGVIRFSLDFLKIDMLQIGPLLLTQWVSIVIVIISLFGLYQINKKQNSLV